MKRYKLNLLLTTIIAILAVPHISFGQKKGSPPNIVLIMVDDMGYSDLGCYGSEIHTPNIDRFAKEGLRLQEFYNNSICAPTRASLLTGQYPHKAGVGYFNINLGLPAYQGFLNQESLTMAEVLKGAGYSTSMVGKWHVGNDSLYWPNQRGFDNFYGFIGGASNYFDIGPYNEKVPPVELVENNKRINLAPGKYLTNEITDHAISYLEEQNKLKKPFFLYMAFNAPHWPLQALPEDIAKYKGSYAIGWDSLRKERLAKQAALGIADPKQSIAVRDSLVPYWESLTYDEQQLWQKKMEVYAAMLDRVDQSVGRVYDELKKLKKEDNTLIIFISDNGAQGGFAPFGRKRPRSSGPIGSAGSYEYEEESWAYVSNSPLLNFKNNMHEGGISSPFIAWFPQKIKAGTITKGAGHIIDIAPTFYDIAGVAYPETYKEIKTNALAGKSLKPLLFNGTAIDGSRAIFWERAGNRAVRKGNWKLVSTYPQNSWELYNMEVDRGETTNLADKYPEVVSELSSAYTKWTIENHVENYSKIKPATPMVIPGSSAPAATVNLINTRSE